MSKLKLQSFGLLILLTINFISFVPTGSRSFPIMSDLSGIKVAVYDGGRGFKEREDSMAALYWMFNWINATVDFVNASSIKQGILTEYQLITVPGGWAYDYYLDLGKEGIMKIQEFVSNGGSYWGSCAGAFFACYETRWMENNRPSSYHYGLALFPGAGVGPIGEIAEWPNYVMTEIILNKTVTTLKLAGENNSHQIMYYGGPYFEVEGISGITIIATYAQTGEPAMIAFEHKKGRVFLTGPHPEWEEDSFRDGCSWDDHLEDEGSEWNFCLKVSLWLTSSATNTTTTSIVTTTTIATTSDGFLISAVINFVIALFLVSKKRISKKN